MTDDKTPAISAVAVEFPPHRHSQADVIAALADFAGPEFHRFAAAAGVEHRNLALPLARYPQLTGFSEANAAYLEVALEIGERALLSALDKAGLQPADVDIIFSTTVTGLAVPTLEARLAGRVGLRPDVKRVPLFGLGCVAGAAGVARMHDYLRAFPDQVAVLLAVELCSLTVQRDDMSMANLVASSLFGDGAAAVVATGANRTSSKSGGPQVLATRSRLYPDTENVMGWDIGTQGFKIVLSADVPDVAEKYLGEDVTLFLAEFGLKTTDIGTWVSHPGGPKVIDAIENVLELPADALAHTRTSLRNNGNLSSASVLDVLRANLAEPPAEGTYGMMIAMGPGFCSELVLLRW
ncbi:MAG: type III polyketide synthase [Mycobacterium sp.]